MKNLNDITAMTYPKRIPYGMMNFVDVREDDCYYVDKTRFIEKIERACHVGLLPYHLRIPPYHRRADRTDETLVRQLLLCQTKLRTYYVKHDKIA